MLFAAKQTNRGFPGGLLVKIHLAMRGTQVRSLVQEDPTYLRATTEPVF